jgi:hypothetical protein
VSLFPPRPESTHIHRSHSHSQAIQISMLNYGRVEVNLRSLSLRRKSRVNRCVGPIGRVTPCAP